MRDARAVEANEEERCGEMLALLNMINYAQAIAGDLKLGNATFHLSEAAQELSGELQRLMQIELSNGAFASLASGKIGRC